MKSKDKPYILYVAEKIYLEVSEIKKKNGRSFPLGTNFNKIHNWCQRKPRPDKIKNICIN